MPWLKRALFPAAVFLTGASVLIIEVTAVRVLAPYYGNTIFTVSGVISVILFALSVGYYAGGRLADRYPSPRMFFGVILASGVLLLLSYAFGATYLPALSRAMSMTSGPLASAAILFLLPALSLGLLSPYAVKLQSAAFPEQGVGSASGTIFFWSTLGSISGSLAAGFVLIPRFGIDRILIANGAFLSLLGLLPLAAFRAREHRRFPRRPLSAFLIALGIALLAFGQADGDPLHAQDGLYERIVIVDGTHEGRPARYFKQDRSVSGAMYLDTDDPRDLVYGYTKYYALHRLFGTEVKDALVIGGGAYSVPKALAADFPEARIDVAEIEPSLFDLAKRYFGVPETPRLNSYAMDGRRFLRDSDKTYDLIFSDVYYSFFSVPSHFTTREFFEEAKSRMSDGGVFIASLIGDLSRGEPSLIMSEIKTFQAVFPNSYFFAVDSPGTTRNQNIVFVGVDGDRRPDFEAAGADPFLGSLEARRIDVARFDLSPYPTLTDDFAPVESLTAHLLKRSLEAPRAVDGDEMLAVIAQQLRFGPRHLSAPGHARMQEFLEAEMRALMPEVEVQAWEHVGPGGETYGLKNIIARVRPELDRRVILATHYDSKKFADQDKERPDLPVPGANDSASGVAVLVELARLLVQEGFGPEVGVDVVFFDGEEGEEDLRGTFEGWEPLGSTRFAARLDDLYGASRPIGGIVLDMVCDRDLRLPTEPSSMKSAPAEVEAFWEMGRSIDARAFTRDVGPGIDDDHRPLDRAGIPSFLVIDYDYPHFHTTEDTIDKCGAESLEKVALTTYAYIRSLK